jgi:hypothetical protein
MHIFYEAIANRRASFYLNCDYRVPVSSVETNERNTRARKGTIELR